jgi:hypothetical protein
LLTVRKKGAELILFSMFLYFILSKENICTSFCSLYEASLESLTRYSIYIICFNFSQFRFIFLWHFWKKMQFKILYFKVFKIVYHIFSMYSVYSLCSQFSIYLLLLNLHFWKTCLIQLVACDHLNKKSDLLFLQML